MNGILIEIAFVKGSQNLQGSYWTQFDLHTEILDESLILGKMPRVHLRMTLPAPSCLKCFKARFPDNLTELYDAVNLKFIWSGYLLLTNIFAISQDAYRSCDSTIKSGSAETRLHKWYGWLLLLCRAFDP